MNLRTLTSLAQLGALASIAACSSSGDGAGVGPDGGAFDDAHGHLDSGAMHAEAGTSSTTNHLGSSATSGSVGPTGSSTSPAGGSSSSPGGSVGSSSGSNAGSSSGAGGSSVASSSTTSGGSNSSGSEPASSGSTDTSSPESSSSSNASETSSSTNASEASSSGSEGFDAGQGSCAAGAVRCVGNQVETCNSNGTAWLESQLCTSGCSSGLCTGTCTPAATRCAGSNVQTCSEDGTAWTDTASCSTFCSTTTNTCAVSPVEITANTNMDGVIVVDGDFVVEPNATLTSPTGNLTIYANSITVQQGGSIVVDATGQNPSGAGQSENSVGGGGGYGTQGGEGEYCFETCDPYGGCGEECDNAGAGNTYGSTTDSVVFQGSAGGAGDGTAGGAGGGVLQLYANTITIAGQVTANGATATSPGGGGSGGGILLAGNTVTVSGAISAVGGGGGATGGNGVIKVLSNTASPSVTGSLTGTVTEALLPPIPITSTSHPDPTQIYNDNFSSFDFSWSPPFPSVQGYYVLGSTSVTVPTPGNAMFTASDFQSLPESTIPGYDPQGDGGTVDAGPGSGTYTLYFQVVPINASSSVGTVETVFPVKINANAPTISSTSHPEQMTWYANPNPYFSWTYPVPNSAISHTYYVLDHYGNTIPDASSTLLPVVQQDLQVSALADGVWVFHLITQDTRGYFTKIAGNYTIFVGADPGSGSLTGTVVDASSQPVAGATVTVNRGVYSTTTNSSGVYNFAQIPAVTWEVSVSSGGASTSASAAVPSGGATTQNLML